MAYFSQCILLHPRQDLNQTVTVVIEIVDSFQEVQCLETQVNSLGAEAMYPSLPIIPVHTSAAVVQ